MSVKTVIWAYEQTGLQPATKFLLVTLADQADSDHYVVASRDLEDLIGLTETGVTECLFELAGRDLIRTAGPNGYHLAVTTPERWAPR